MRNHGFIVAGKVLVLLVGLASSTSAQDVANGQATANVLAGLTVNATQSLDFGNVYQGVAKTQDETSDANSGFFTITGQANAGISVYLHLPDYIALVDGSARMQIAFGNQDCAFSVLCRTVYAVRTRRRSVAEPRPACPERNDYWRWGHIPDFPRGRGDAISQPGGWGIQR